MARLEFAHSLDHSLIIFVRDAAPDQVAADFQPAMEDFDRLAVRSRAHRVGRDGGPAATLDDALVTRDRRLGRIDVPCGQSRRAERGVKDPLPRSRVGFNVLRIAACLRLGRPWLEYSATPAAK
jgi:hypothetical protein